MEADSPNGEAEEPLATTDFDAQGDTPPAPIEINRGLLGAGFQDVDEEIVRPSKNPRATVSLNGTLVSSKEFKSELPVQEFFSNIRESGLRTVLSSPDQLDALLSQESTFKETTSAAKKLHDILAADARLRKMWRHQFTPDYTVKSLLCSGGSCVEAFLDHRGRAVIVFGSHRWKNEKGSNKFVVRHEGNIGNGGFAFVRIGIHEEAGVIACKDAFDIDEEEQERSKTEAMCLKQAPDDSTTEYVSYNQPHCRILMKHCSGVPLSKLLSRKFDAQTANVLGLDIGFNLRAVHDDGVRHGDLTPGNVMVRDDGKTVLMDFGRGFITADEHLLTLKKESIGADGKNNIQLFGTAHYLAPEVLRYGAKRRDAKTDVWNWALLLYEMHMGQKLFDKDVYGLEDIKKAVFGDQEAREKIIAKMEEVLSVKLAVLREKNSLIANLIEKGTVFDPSKRIAMDDALSELIEIQYGEDMRKQYSENLDAFPQSERRLVLPAIATPDTRQKYPMHTSYATDAESAGPNMRRIIDSRDRQKPESTLRKISKQVLRALTTLLVFSTNGDVDTRNTADVEAQRAAAIPAAVAPVNPGSVEKKREFFSCSFPKNLDKSSDVQLQRIDKEGVERSLRIPTGVEIAQAMNEGFVTVGLIDSEKMHAFEGLKTEKKNYKLVTIQYTVAHPETKKQISYVRMFDGHHFIITEDGVRLYANEDLDTSGLVDQFKESGKWDPDTLLIRDPNYKTIMNTLRLEKASSRMPQKDLFKDTNYKNFDHVIWRNTVRAGIEELRGKLSHLEVPERRHYAANRFGNLGGPDSMDVMSRIHKNMELALANQSGH